MTDYTINVDNESSFTNDFPRGNNDELPTLSSNKKKIQFINALKDLSTQYNQKFIRYTETKHDPSDFWLFPFVVIIENVFSLAVGGYFWFMILGFFFVLLMNVLWSLIFNIPGVKEIFNNFDFVSLFSSINFLAALLYVKILESYIVSSSKPLELYRKSTQIIKNISSSFDLAFDYDIKSMQLFLNSEHYSQLSSIDNDKRSMDRKLKQWFKDLVKTENKMTYMLFFMSLYSLRVFLEEDYDFEYETKYGLSKQQLKKLEKLVDVKKTTNFRPNAEDFMEKIIEITERQIYSFNLRVMIKNYPQIPANVLENVNINIRSLRTNIQDSIIFKSIPEQNSHIFIRNFFVFFWIIVILPFIAFDSVSTLLPLFGTIVEFLCVIPLINAWFVGKPFVHSGRYAGPNYFNWRKILYKTIFIDHQLRKQRIEKIKDDINGKIKLKKSEVFA